MNASTSIRRQAFQQFFSLILSIVVALILGITILALDGNTPKEVFSSAYSSTFASDYRFGNLLARLVSIVLGALAAAIPFKAGLWNIGGDGQLLVGAFAAALVGFSFTNLPPVLHVSLAVIAGMLGGAFWAAIPGYIRLKFNANEVVTTIMMNYLATYFTGYLVNYPFHSPGSPNAETPRIFDSAFLPTLIPMSNLSAGLFLAVFMYLLIYFIDKRTVWGYEWRVLGVNEEFSRYGGVSDKKMKMLAMCIGGALAGLAGSILVLGSYHKFIAGMGGGVGFTGVLIAIIAANSPIIILMVAMVFAILQNSIIGMQSKIGVAVEFSDIIQSVIILLVIVRSSLWSSIKNIFSNRKHYGNV